MTITTTKGTDRLGIVYPETDNMADNILHKLMAIQLLLVLKRFIREVTEGTLATEQTFDRLRAQRPLFCCSDQFWYYREGDPKSSVAPDVYVLAGIHPDTVGGSWKLWELHHAPLFALEIVSQDVDKDYDEAPKAYEHTAVRELVIFDPEAPRVSPTRGSRERFRWQLWRRNEEHRWQREVATNDDRVQSVELCCWLRLVGSGDKRLLRIGVGLNGDELFLTEDEAARQATEQERRAREELAEKVRALEAQLAALMQQDRFKS